MNICVRVCVCVIATYMGAHGDHKAVLTWIPWISSFRQLIVSRPMWVPMWVPGAEPLLQGSSSCFSSLRQAPISVLFSFSFYLFYITIVLPTGVDYGLSVASRVPPPRPALCAPADRIILELDSSVLRRWVPVVVCDCQLPAPIEAVPGVGEDSPV